ncbi:hypothetical protein FB45DRAFT_1000585 [Roridomyces roridus]|uniref:Uncharacterized protein n=1 Tax=Roridomyces roridus TaxID=1738132 RepID=A0AAD7C9G8_9AGAR|nr:hypothetical protein FB45DRAFT_1000585 [Roridomyces roridus]
MVSLKLLLVSLSTVILTSNALPQGTTTTSSPVSLPTIPGTVRAKLPSHVGAVYFTGFERRMDSPGLLRGKHVYRAQFYLLAVFAEFVLNAQALGFSFLRYVL